MAKKQTRRPTKQTRRPTTVPTASAVRNPGANKGRNAKPGFIDLPDADDIWDQINFWSGRGDQTRPEMVNQARDMTRSVVNTGVTALDAQFTGGMAGSLYNNVLRPRTDMNSSTNANWGGVGRDAAIAAGTAGAAAAVVKGGRMAANNQHVQHYTNRAINAVTGQRVGIHGSPYSGLRQIKPFTNSHALPEMEVSYAWNSDPLRRSVMRQEAVTRQFSKFSRLPDNILPDNKIIFRNLPTEDPSKYAGGIAKENANWINQERALDWLSSKPNLTRSGYPTEEDVAIVLGDPGLRNKFQQLEGSIYVTKAPKKGSMVGEWTSGMPGGNVVDVPPKFRLPLQAVATPGPQRVIGETRLGDFRVDTGNFYDYDRFGAAEQVRDQVYRAGGTYRTPAPLDQKTRDIVSAKMEMVNYPHHARALVKSVRPIDRLKQAFMPGAAASRNRR